MGTDGSRTIVITGASRGIGAATGRLCGARSWNVAINYLKNVEAAEETAAAVRSAGGRAILVGGDAAEEATIVRIFEATVDAFGWVDGLVNNAGTIEPRMPLAEMSAERIARLFTVNAVGPFLAAREAIRRMSRSRGGRGGSIVNVSSMAALLGSAGEFVDYAATKGALDVLTIGLSKELGAEGIRVNSVRPGLIDTTFHAGGGFPERAFANAGRVPMGRPGSPEETAKVIVWLLSDESSYVNGAHVNVSGGR